MNSWFLTASVKNFKFKDNKFPSMWLQLELDPIKLGENVLDNNYIFVNASINNDQSTKQGRITSYIRQNLSQDSFVYLEDFTFSMVSRSELKDGEWVKKEEPGFKFNISNMRLSNTRYQPLNRGEISGKIINHSGNKALLQETYRVPNGTSKTRDLPILFMEDVSIDLTNKYITIFGQVAGATPNGHTHYILAQEYIIK